jgi:hypothetical protein
MPRMIKPVLALVIFFTQTNTQDIKLTKYELKHAPVIGSYHGVERRISMAS